MIDFDGDIDCIGECAFDGCRQLATVEFADKVNTIEYLAFADTAIKDMKIPEGAEVDPDAFAGSPLELKK